MGYYEDLKSRSSFQLFAPKLKLLEMLRNPFFIIFNVLIALLCLQLQASEDCGSVNVLDKYSDRAEASKKMLEFFSRPRDQNSWGACYAFTAADMLSFELNIPVSALHMTAKFEKQKADEGGTYEGGESLKAMLLAQSGICSEEDLPNFTNLYAYRNKDLKNMMETIDRMKVMVKQGRQQELCKTVQSDLKISLKNLSLGEIVAILAHNSEKSAFEVLNQFAERNCRQKVQVPQFQFEKSDATPIYRTENGKQIQVFGDPQEADRAIQTLDEGLSKGKLVAIGYKPIKMLNLEHDDPNVGHASTVLGRKMINGQCMYIVRNSWGNSPCGNRQVPDGIICGTKEGQQEIPFGTYMVSRKTLQEYIDDSFYVK